MNIQTVDIEQLREQVLEFASQFADDTDANEIHAALKIEFREQVIIASQAPNASAAVDAVTVEYMIKMAMAFEPGCLSNQGTAAEIVAKMLCFEYLGHLRSFTVGYC